MNDVSEQAVKQLVGEGAEGRVTGRPGGRPGPPAHGVADAAGRGCRERERVTNAIDRVAGNEP